MCSGVDWGPEGTNQLLECVHLPVGPGPHLGVAWPRGRLRKLAPPSFHTSTGSGWQGD